MGSLDPILVVEDDEDVRFHLRQLLEEEGYHTAGAANGQQALSYLRSHPNTRLVLLDLLMPEMNGWTFRQNQLKDPSLAHIPVIVLSGAKTPGIEAIKACAFISKPGNLDKLFTTIARCVRP